MEEALAEVLADEVVGKVGVEAVLYAVDVIQGTGKGFIVSQVGDDDITGVDLRQGGGFRQQGLQTCDSCFFLGRNR